MDIIATLSPQEYRFVKAELEREGLWNRADREHESNRRAEQLITIYRDTEFQLVERGYIR
jgi:hypothetical protein